MAFTHDENASDAPQTAVAPGRLEFTFANPSAKRVPLLGINVPDHYQIKLARHLSGARLLSHQTFLDLFPSETMASFHRPLDALRASIEMRTAIARFNE